MDFPFPEDHCMNMMSKIYLMRTQPALCDVSILIEGRLYWAHKCILVAACPTLHGIILGDSDNAQRETLQLTLQGLTCKGFEALLRYVYTGVPPKDQDTPLFQDFKKACRALGVLEVTEHDNRIDNMKADLAGSDVDQVDGANSKLLIEVVTSSMAEEEYEEVVQEVEDIEMDDAAESGEATVNLQENWKEQVTGATNNADISSDDDEDESVDKDKDYVPDQDGSDVDKECSSNQDENEDSQQSRDNTAGEENKANNFDITSLFSVKQRADGSSIAEKETTAENSDTAVEKYRPEIDIPQKKSRGRPRLDNDHLFPTKPPFICPHGNCMKVFDTRDKVKKHYRNHAEKTFACGLCDKKFLYKKDVAIHKRVHTGEKPYECGTCGMSFAQKNVLTNHIQTHTSGQKFPCVSCKKVYQSSRSLALHVREKHVKHNMANFACQSCGEAYENQESYLMHVKNGCGEDCHMCRKCGRLFKIKSRFEQHVKICGKIKYNCGLCDYKTFSTKNKLAKHLEFTHNVHPVTEEDIVAVTSMSEDASFASNSENHRDGEIIEFTDILLEEV